MGEQTTMASLPKLGLIAGGGALPTQIANLYQERGGQCVLASINEEINQLELSSKSFSIGSVGGILEYFAENSVEQVIIVGGIKRPDLKSIKVDIAGSVLLARILKEKLLGDDKILKIVSSYIESKGFKVISPVAVLKLGNYTNNISSKKSLSKQDKNDAEIGKELLKSLGYMDVGQSVIVADGYVLGIEAAEGTDNLIKRCALLRKKSKGGVLVKMSKPGQDMRLDVPAIGPETARLLAEHDFNGVAAEQNGVIIIDPQKTLKLLDEGGMFLWFL